MTKKELISKIATLLDQSGKEVCVSDFSRLRNGRWGYHAYCLVSKSGVLEILPWSGSDISWSAELERLTKEEISVILERASR